MQKLVIPGRLDGLNEYTKANRTNLYKGAYLKKSNESVIMDCIQLQKIKATEEKVFLSFHWYEPNKRRDKDNIASAKKFILDALVKTGTLPNDNWKYIQGFADYFDIDKENPRIEVMIEEAAEDKNYIAEDKTS